MKRRNVGVIIGNLEVPHAYELLRGISKAAVDLDANLFVFPGMHSKSYYDKSLLEHREIFDYQFNTIYDYVNEEKIDILLVSLGTVVDFLGTDNYREFLDRFDKIPMIVLEDILEGETCVTMDNVEGLYRCIRHLIVDHNYKKIAFVTGRKNNYDAKQRLRVYQALMKQYDLPILDGMIGYGDFTEYTDELVGKILDMHPDTQAICFANDMMALGGYRECKRRGLVIGKDIAITGFDDNLQAVFNNPTMTTVRVRPFRLGYRALELALDKIEGRKTVSQKIKSKLIIRGSCGCNPNVFEDVDYDYKNSSLEEVTIQHVNYIISEITNESGGDKMRKEVSLRLYDTVKMLLWSVKAEQLIPNEELIYTNVEKMLYAEHSAYFSVYSLQQVLLRFIQSLIKYAETEELRKQLARITTVVFSTISVYLQADSQNQLKRKKKESWYTNYVTRDTTVYSTNEKEALYQIVTKMNLLHIKSSYIYLFEKPIKNYDNHYWKCPDKMYLAAMQNERRVLAYDVEDRPFVTLEEGINNSFAKSKRYTALHFSLFSNENQYGLLLCEAEIEDASLVYSISLQIGTALHFMELMREQMELQKQMHKNMELISRKNDLLNRISIYDELTELYNRRGVFDAMSRQLEENPGRQIAVVFIDLDNLKQTNDTFGHNEGDFALKSVSDILKKSFRGQDPIGRIGGDEFIGYMVIDEPGVVPELKKRLEFYTKELNASCGKPYYIEMSVGIKEMIGHQQMDLKDILKQADSVLYLDKKKKRASSLKE